MSLVQSSTIIKGHIFISVELNLSSTVFILSERAVTNKVYICIAVATDKSAISRCKTISQSIISTAFYRG